MGLVLVAGATLAGPTGATLAGPTGTAHAGEACVEPAGFDLSTAGVPPCDGDPGRGDPCGMAPIDPPPLQTAGAFGGPPPVCDPGTPVEPGQLVVTKVVVGGPALASDFGFTVTLGGVPLLTFVEQFPGANGTTTFSIAFKAVVTVEETTTQPNYAVDDSDCVNVVVGLGQTSSCTITNTFVPSPPPAALTILKATTESSSAEQFGFTSSLGNFSLADGESRRFVELAAGSYSVTEAT